MDKKARIALGTIDANLKSAKRGTAAQVGRLEHDFRRDLGVQGKKPTTLLLRPVLSRLRSHPTSLADSSQNKGE